MPACMAHYQFGQDILKRLDADMRASALAHKQEYDIGLQGPDIFFFYKPYKNNEISGYGIERHAQPAIRMFAPILENVHEEEALSYLLGLLCHYALDRSCHPYVYRHSRDSRDHMRMESAYDRHIMSRCGITGARYLAVPASELNYEKMASLWPGMTADTVRDCVKSQRRDTWLLDHKNFLDFCETALNKRGAFTSMTLPHSVVGIQAEHASCLDAFYEKALNECPELIRGAIGFMRKQRIFCPGFDWNYEGEME